MCYLVSRRYNAGVAPEGQGARVGGSPLVEDIETTGRLGKQALPACQEIFNLVVTPFSHQQPDETASAPRLVHHPYPLPTPRLPLQLLRLAVTPDDRI